MNPDSLLVLLEAASQEAEEESETMVDIFLNSSDGYVFFYPALNTRVFELLKMIVRYWGRKQSSEWIESNPRAEEEFETMVDMSLNSSIFFSRKPKLLKK